MAVFFCKKKIKKKWRKWTICWGLIFQEWLALFISDLVSVLSWYAGTCTENLVLFGLEITQLQMGIKSYFALCVNILTLCTHTPFSWAAWHTTICVDNVTWCGIIKEVTTCIQYSRLTGACQKLWTYQHTKMFCC